MFICGIQKYRLIILVCSGGVENIKVGFKDTNMNPGTWTTAFFAALWSYSGWLEFLNFIFYTVNIKS